MSRDEQILAAAERLFYERGFHGVGVDEIGVTAGISGSAIYRHFSGKDEILAALFDRVIDAVLLGVGAAKDDPREELEHLVRTFVQFAFTHQRLTGVWEREERALVEPYRRRYRRSQRPYLDRWLQCLGECYPTADRAELTTALRGVLALLTSDAIRPLGSQRAARAEDMLSAMALRGLDVLAGVARPKSW
ncbi:TetR/AcrR family transcriptional regulator [Mycobacterium syngnathidarum]